MYYLSLLKAFPWELSVGARNSWATGPRKKNDDTFSRVDTIYQRDGQTDGHRATDRAYA